MAKLFEDIKKYPVSDILEYIIETNRNNIKLEDYHINVNNYRYTTFLNKGTNCVSCGAVGDCFILQHSPKYTQPRLNLYCRNKDDNLVYMTVDHIILKSKGGLNSIDNLSPMCENCNQRRGDEFEDQLEFINKVQSGEIQVPTEGYKTEYLTWGDKRKLKQQKSSIMNDSHVKYFYINRKIINEQII